MAIPSGLGAQLGIAAEGTYGTYTAPTTFLRPVKAGLKKVKNTDQGQGITAGQLLAAGARRAVTTIGATGSVDLELTTKKMGLLVQALMGTSVTPTLLETGVYQQLHTLADQTGKSLSLQLGLPDAGGVVRPYTYLGCKVTSAQFDIEPGKIVTCSFEFDGQDVSEAQSLAAASFSVIEKPFIGTQGALKVGSTYGSEAAVANVTKASIKIDRKLATDRYYLGGAGKKAEPLANDYVAITGTISADFTDKTVWADRFASDAEFSLDIPLVGALIGATKSETFEFKIPGCRLDGDTPGLDGPDMISGDFTFQALFDGTNLPSITIISTETTLG